VVVLSTNEALQKVKSETRGGEAPVVDVVVFTCKHQYTRRELTLSLLPRFSRLLDELPHPLPLTAALATAEYRQKYVTLACPMCLYSAISKNEAAAKPL